MITLKPTGPKSLLIYKTHLSYLGFEHSIILKNAFSDYELPLEYQIGELHNSYKIEITNTNLAAMAGQNTLLVKNAEGAIIYSEEVRILE